MDGHPHLWWAWAYCAQPMIWEVAGEVTAGMARSGPP
jgi:hypothetical protein